MKKLYLEELDESLKIIGHSHLWLQGDKISGLPDYFEVISADERDLAWWCADSRSWFLNEEADVITPFNTTQTPNLPPNRELIEENILGLSILFNC